MSASIGTAHGAEKADPAWAGQAVAVIGDSTVLHSGLTGLLNVVYNSGSSTVLILDNSTTAMTGHQQHPGTGYTLMGKSAPAVDLEALVRALGVKRVRLVNPRDLAEVAEAVKEEVAVREPSVIICRQPCACWTGSLPRPRVLMEKCTGCKTCLGLGCPAIAIIDKKVSIDSGSCTGCGLCVQVCKTGALAKGGADHA